MKCVRLFSILIILFGCVSYSYSQSRMTCGGRMPNPVSDICWMCIFPINIAGVVPITANQVPNHDAPPPTMCACPMALPPYVRWGFGVSFWETARFIEVVRQPYCSPTLGGVEMDSGSPLWAGTNHSQSRGTGWSFYHAHVFTAPIMDWVGATIASGICMSSNNSMDIMFMTELDPIWNDDAGSLSIAPEAVLFNNPVTILACVADSASAIVSQFGLDPLFWCAGTAGHAYPMTGHNAGHHGAIDSTVNTMAKAIMTLHRVGLAQDTSTEAALCGSVYQPIWRKNQYKYNMMYPTPRPERGLGIGAPTWFYAGAEFPYEGEDYNYMVFRKRKCCAL